MNTLVDDGRKASFADNRIHVVMPNGFEFPFPIAGNWRLEGVTPAQLCKEVAD